MMEEFWNDLDKIKLFLARFSKDHCQKLSEDDPLPHRLLSFFLVEKEVEAEVMDWIIQYLTAQKAPNLLCSLVAREAVKEVVKWELTSYLEPLPSSQRCEDDKSESNNGDSDTDILEDVETDGTPKIEVSKLARDVFNKVHEICREWAEELPESVTGLPQDKSPIVAISVHAIRNTRRKMEDRHLVMPYLSQQFELKDPTQALFTVFDGHGGTEAAIYSAAHLHYHMVRHPAFTDDPISAINDSFTHTDEQFVAKAKREHLRSGSTCVSALLRGDKLYVSWLGDSQVMLVRNGQPLQVMDPHKPEREDERKRIESQGGFVMWFGQWRVNATLSVSRAIGDPEFKPFVCAQPDINTINLSGEEDYIVLACDGLWDTMSFDDVANDIYKFLEKTDDKADVARMLSQRAKEKGSGDNISVIVVFLKDKPAKPKPMEKPEEKKKENVSEGGDDSSDAKEEEKEIDKDEEKENISEKHTHPEGSETQNAPAELEHGMTNKMTGSNSSCLKPLGTVGLQSQVPILFKKPVPYNVYKVLLKHQHHHSKYKSQTVERPTGSSGVPEEKVDATMQQPKASNVPEVLIKADANASLKLSNERVNISTQATKYLCLSDKRSDTSSTHIILDSSTKSISSARKVNKKGKNGKKRNLHRDLRRLSRDRLSLGIAERARSSNSSGSSPRSLHHQFLRKKFLTPKSTKAAASSAIQGPSGVKARTSALEKQVASSKMKNVVGGSGITLEGNVGRGINRKWEGELLTGMMSSFGSLDLSPTSGASKWTVAREIENAAAMFGE